MTKILSPTRIGLLVFGAFFLAACGHHRDVRPGAEGIHRVLVVEEDEEKASREAIEQSEHYCKQTGKFPAFVDENKKYVGDMDEKSYKTAKTASKVAQAAGSAAWVFGGKNESTAGGIVGLGG